MSAPRSTPPGPPQPALLANAAELRRLLEVIEMEILPKTAVRVAAGDKVFGAAILKEDLGTVVAETNHETENPMYHGEVYAIREWSSVCRSCDPSVGPPAAVLQQVLAVLLQAGGAHAVHGLHGLAGRGSQPRHVLQGAVGRDHVGRHVIGLGQGPPHVAQLLQMPRQVPGVGARGRC